LRQRGKIHEAHRKSGTATSPHIDPGIYSDSRVLFGFRELEYFELTDGFLHGKNTLQFWVNNEGRGPTGLLVSDLTGIAAEIPIPAAVWLLGSGLVAVIGLRRRIHN
jgi:hypothetical protein